MARHKDLMVFQKADELALLIYKTTGKFPKMEAFGITSQPRRAALSVPTNIVEGYARKSKKELAQFINIALGSLAETEYLLDFSKRLGYCGGDTMQIDGLIEEVGKLLWGFYRSLQECVFYFRSSVFPPSMASAL